MKSKHMNDELLYFKEEMKWKKEQNQRDTGREILETMGYEGAKDMLTPIMEDRIERKKDFDKAYRRINRITKKYYAPDTFEFEFAVDTVWSLKFLNDDIKNQNQLKSLEQYWLFNESRRPRVRTDYKEPREDFSLLIAVAKDVTIESLLKNTCKRSGANRLVSLCPFHTEKTASFTIFNNTNTFFCFGCGAKGDAITFYQKFYGVSFVEAVRNLTGQY